VAAESAYGFENAMVVCGHSHHVDGFGTRCGLVNELDHGFAGDAGQRFTLKTGGPIAGWDNCGDFHLLHVCRDKRIDPRERMV
jgi:hypothetical protein